MIDANENDIAIIGMACHFPKTPDTETFREHLLSGTELLTHFTQDELLSAGVTLNEIRAPGYVATGAMIDGIELFDAGFFNFSPKEAQITSPQQRFLLQCAYHALQHAGYCADKYEGDIGVFASTGFNTYFAQNLQSNPQLIEDVGRKTIQFGNDLTFSATQLAYKLNLTGPAISLSTACSSSLVALHLACQSLLNYECDMALVGTSQISVNHNKGYQIKPGGILSDDGHCRAFSKCANGTVSGNGTAAIVVKRLSDAIRDGDVIDAVVAGSAINNDGNDKVGFSAPSISGQAAVIFEAQARAGVKPEHITCIESHGTGTLLGDPVEFAALKEVFAESQTPCALGSLKSNLGHMGATAGLGAVIKLVCGLEQEKIYPTLHCAEPNPELAIEDSCFYLPQEAQNWETQNSPRIAGISSFGMGGTNAHVIVKQAPQQTASQLTEKPYYLFTLSAHSQNAFDETVRLFAEHLNHTEAHLADIEYSLNQGREELGYRQAFVCSNKQNLLQMLSSAPTPVLSEQEQKLCFLFTGQGAQMPNMAARLHSDFPVFRGYFQTCVDEFAKHGVNLEQIVFGTASADLLRQTDNAQVALFSIEYALAKSVMALGVTPSIMLGHSLGEYVAATIAGVFSFEDAVYLVHQRGKLMQNSAPGKMVAVKASVAECEKLLIPGVGIAAINGKEAVVISGSKQNVDEILEVMPADIEYRIINDSFGFHSHMMDSVLTEFRQVLQKVSLHAPDIPFISNVTGQVITDIQATSVEYWVDHMRQPVDFESGVETARNHVSHFAEVGPGRILQGLVKKHLSLSPETDQGTAVLSFLPTQHESLSSLQTFYQSLANLWQDGFKINWDAFYQEKRGRRVRLPLYPYQKSAFWVSESAAATSQETHSDLKYYIPTWQPESLEPVSVAKQSDWLLIGAESQTKAFADYLMSENHRVLTVDPVSGLSEDGKFDDVAFAEKLTDAMSSRDSSGVGHILWFDPLLSDAETACGVPSVSDQTRFIALASLVKTLKCHVLEQAQSLCLVSTGLFTGRYPATGLTGFSGAAATLANVAGQECSGLKSAFINIENPGQFTGQIHVQLYNEILAGLPATSVSLNGRQRKLTHHLQITPNGSTGGQVLKDGGCYLITGGTSGIGLVVADYLVTHFNANVVLLSRSAKNYSSGEPLPQESDSSLAALIDKCESKGKGIIVASCDVTDKQALHHAMDNAKAVFGRIDGVVHAAGLAGGAIIERIESQRFEQVIAVKKKGAENLVDWFADDIPDFVLLCSSQNAIKGGAGMAEYSAANACMDQLAHQLTAETCIPVTSVNWPSWLETGMAFRSRKGMVDSTVLAQSVSNSEGCVVFETLCTLPGPRIIVSKQPFAEVLKKQKTQEVAEQKILERTSANRNSESNRPASLSTVFRAPENSVETTLQEIWQSLLGINGIGMDDQYFELGGNSLLLSQMAHQINKYFNTELRIQHLLSAQTIAAQSALVMERTISHTEIEEIEHLLNDIEQLSEAEVDTIFRNQES